MPPLGPSPSSTCAASPLPRRRRRPLVLRHRPSGRFLAAGGVLVAEAAAALRVTHEEDVLALLVLPCEPAAFELVTAPCARAVGA